MFNDVKNYRCEIKHSTIYPEKGKKKKKKREKRKRKRRKGGRKEEKKGEKKGNIFIRQN